jgi:hypothetical protein
MANPLIGKVLMLLTSTQVRIKMSRTPGKSEGFRRKDGVYYLGCRRSIGSLLKRRPPTILRLF